MPRSSDREPPPRPLLTPAERRDHVVWGRELMADEARARWGEMWEAETDAQFAAWQRERREERER